MARARDIGRLLRWALLSLMAMSLTLPGSRAMPCEDSDGCVAACPCDDSDAQDTAERGHAALDCSDDRGDDADDPCRGECPDDCSRCGAHGLVASPATFPATSGAAPSWRRAALLSPQARGPAGNLLHVYRPPRLPA